MVFLPWFGQSDFSPGVVDDALDRYWNPAAEADIASKSQADAGAFVPKKRRESKGLLGTVGNLIGPGSGPSAGKLCPRPMVTNGRLFCSVKAVYAQGDIASDALQACAHLVFGSNPSHMISAGKVKQVKGCVIRPGRVGLYGIAYFSEVELIWKALTRIPSGTRWTSQRLPGRCSPPG